MITDTIGYFPQMVISSIATIVLLLILAVREFDIIGLQAESQHPRTVRLPSASAYSSVSHPRHSIRRFTGYQDSDSSSSYCSSARHSRPPPSPHPNSTPAEIAEWEKYRMQRHLTGQFVFPPVQLMPTHRAQTSSQTTVKPSKIHRRVNTMTRIMEAGQVPRSHWSDED